MDITVQSTKTHRTIQRHGEVVIPSPIRVKLELKPGTPVEIYEENGTVLIRKWKGE